MDGFQHQENGRVIFEVFIFGNDIFEVLVFGNDIFGVYVFVKFVFQGLCLWMLIFDIVDDPFGSLSQKGWSLLTQGLWLSELCVRWD